MIGEFSDLTITHLVCILVERRHSLAAETGYWEFDARRGDGTTLPIEFAAGHVDLPDAEHYTLVVRDITFRREAEARDRQRQAQLVHFSRVSLASKIAAGLARELSQPLR